MSRKIKILLLIGLLLIVAIIVYMLLNKKSNTPPNNPNPGVSQTTTAITDSTKNQSTNIDYPIQDSVYFPHHSDGYVFYISGTDGNIYKFDSTTGINNSYELKNSLGTVEQIVWSPQATKVLIQAYDEKRTIEKYYIYDLANKNLRSVKQNISSGIWKDENNLIYCQNDNGLSALKSVNVTLGTVANITNLTNSCNILKHYSATINSVYFQSNKSEVLADLIEFNLDNLQETIVFQNDFLDSILSPDNQQILIENSNNPDTNNAYLLDLLTKKVSQIPKMLNIDQTIWKDENNLLVLTVNQD